MLDGWCPITVSLLLRAAKVPHVHSYTHVIKNTGISFTLASGQIISVPIFNLLCPSNSKWIWCKVVREKHKQIRWGEAIRLSFTFKRFLWLKPGNIISNEELFYCYCLLLTRMYSMLICLTKNEVLFSLMWAIWHVFTFWCCNCWPWDENILFMHSSSKDEFNLG